MRSITVYEAEDGSRWDTRTAAIKRDAEVASVEAIMASLSPVHDDPLFSNGASYYQHDLEVLWDVKLSLWKITKKRLKRYLDSASTSEAQKVINDPYLIYRLLDNNSPISRAWARFMCIDEQGREWGQPYFANHPEESAVCMNDPHTQKVSNV